MSYYTQKIKRRIKEIEKIEKNIKEETDKIARFKMWGKKARMMSEISFIVDDYFSEDETF